VELVSCYERLKGPGTESGMKRKNLASWIFTMLISLGTFAGVLTAMGTLDVPTASTVTATPPSSPASPSSLASNTPVSLASPPAGGGDDSSFAAGSSSGPDN